MTAHSMVPLLLASLVLFVSPPPPATAQLAPATFDGAPTPSFADTLRTDQIEQENGFTVVQSTGAPFTGIVFDTYPNGAKKLRRAVVNGLPEGLWMEWYESGVPRYQATWRGGRGHGLWTYYHENGDIRERVAVVDDVYHGLMEGWHANGHKATQGRYRNGEKDGRWQAWNEAGQLTAVEIYRSGTLLHRDAQTAAP